MRAAVRHDGRMHGRLTRRDLLARRRRGRGPRPTRPAVAVARDRTAARPRRTAGPRGAVPAGRHVRSAEPPRDHDAGHSTSDADRPGPLLLQVAADEGFERVVLQKRVDVTTGAADTARHRVRSKKLRPGERYWYRFESADGGSPVGRFQLLRPSGLPRAGTHRRVLVPDVLPRLVHRPRGPRRPRTWTRSSASGTTSTRPTSTGCRAREPRPDGASGGSSDPRRIPREVRRVPTRRAPPSDALRARVPADLGRPRGRRQLRR